MKIVKYILFFICVFLISCMTNEIAIENHMIEQCTNTYTCFFDIHTPEEVEWMVQAAEKTNVQVFVKTESLISAGNTEHTFYQVNANEFQSSFALPNPYRSISKGVVTETIRPLSEIPSVHENISFYVRKNAGDTQTFFDLVTQKVPMIKRNANPFFTSPFSNAMILGWLLFYAVILFLAFFYVCCIRRELAIRTCFGFSVARSIFGNVLLDTAVYLALIFIQYLILSQYSTFALKNNYVYYYGAALLCGIIPYFSLLRFHVKDISHRNLGLIRLFRCSYILKFCAVVMLFFSFSLFASVGLKAVSTYRTAQTAQELNAYDILKLESDTASEKYKKYHEEIDDDAFADRQCKNDAYNAFYFAYRKNVMLMSASHYDAYDIVYYNENAASVLNSILGDTLAACSADVVMLCPKVSKAVSLKDISERNNEMLYTYSKFCGSAKDINIETITYEKNIKVPYFSVYDNNLIDFASNPYIVFCRKAPTDLNIMSGNLNMVDSVIASPDNQKYLHDFEASHDYISASLIDLNQSLQYLYEKSTRELLSIMLLIAIMLVLQYIVTLVLVSFYHKINMKEIAILRTTGASFFKKYGKHLIIQTMIYVITGLAGAFIIRRSIAEWKLVMILFVCSAVLDVVFYMIMNTIQERKNIVKVLKGGFL